MVCGLSCCKRPRLGRGHRDLPPAPRPATCCTAPPSGRTRVVQERATFRGTTSDHRFLGRDLALPVRHVDGDRVAAVGVLRTLASTERVARRRRWEL